MSSIQICSHPPEVARLSRSTDHRKRAPKIADIERIKSFYRKTANIFKDRKENRQHSPGVVKNRNITDKKFNNLSLTIKEKPSGL